MVYPDHSVGSKPASPSPQETPDIHTWKKAKPSRHLALLYLSESPTVLTVLQKYSPKTATERINTQLAQLQ